MMAVLAHLQEASKRDGMKEDALQEAVFAISNAYSLNIHNAATKERYPLNALSLVDIFKAGRAQLLPSTEANGSVPRTVPTPSEKRDVDDSTTVKMDEGFSKFVSRLKETTTFLKGVEEGTPEYDQRLRRAREKYDAKRAEKKNRSAPPPPGAVQSSKSSIDPSVKKEAEELKARGNSELKAKNYEAALDLYTKCIQLDGSNAVYYSNRAAANVLLSRFTEAVDDCKRAIGLDSKFLRPRERLASAYKYLGMTTNEIDALKGAIRLDPSNRTLAGHLADAEGRLANENNSAARDGGSAGAGNPMASMFGGMPVDASSINQMARSFGVNIPDETIDSFMNSGAMNHMATMMQQNPEMMQRAMQTMMGGGFPGMGGGNGNDGAVGQNPSNGDEG